jgi:hypothetical protein
LHFDDWVSAGVGFYAAPHPASMRIKKREQIGRGITNGVHNRGARVGPGSAGIGSRGSTTNCVGQYTTGRFGSASVGGQKDLCSLDFPAAYLPPLSNAVSSARSASLRSTRYRMFIVDAAQVEDDDESNH